MKVIIDIDEQHFELLQMAVRNGMGDNAQKIIALGTPILDKQYEQTFDWLKNRVELAKDEALDFGIALNEWLETKKAEITQ